MKGSVRVSFAVSLLRDDAAIWWRNHVEQSDIGQEILIDDWNDFKKALIVQFKPVNSRKIARDKLTKLKQSKSVQDYATTFRSLVLEISGISEDEKVDRFIRGLKDQIRMEVELREPSTLNDAIRIADRYDTITFKYQKQKVDQVKKLSSDAYLDPAPMDLDINKYRKLTDKEKDKLRQDQACFYCRQSRHLISTCPLNTKKKISAIQTSSPIKKPTLSSEKKKVIKSMICNEESDNNQEGELNTFDEDQNSELLHLTGYIKTHPVRILIDGGASRNFIAEHIIKKAKLKTTQEADAGVVILADGSRQPCNLFVSNVSLRIASYQEKLTFFITKLKMYDIVLGKS